VNLGVSGRGLGVDGQSGFIHHRLRVYTKLPPLAGHGMPGHCTMEEER